MVPFQSVHDNGQEDRQWTFECDRPLGGVPLGECFTSEGANALDQPINYQVCALCVPCQCCSSSRPACTGHPSIQKLILLHPCVPVPQPQWEELRPHRLHLTNLQHRDKGQGLPVPVLRAPDHMHRDLHKQRGGQCLGCPHGLQGTTRAVPSWHQLGP